MNTTPNWVEILFGDRRTSKTVTWKVCIPEKWAYYMERFELMRKKKTLKIIIDYKFNNVFTIWCWIPGSIKIEMVKISYEQFRSSRGAPHCLDLIKLTSN